MGKYDFSQLKVKQLRDIARDQGINHKLNKRALLREIHARYNNTSGNNNQHDNAQHGGTNAPAQWEPAQPVTNEYLETLTEEQLTQMCARYGNKCVGRKRFLILWLQYHLGLPVKRQAHTAQPADTPANAGDDADKPHDGGGSDDTWCGE